MNDDAFARAARALRESVDGTSPQAASTRGRLLERARARQKRRRRAALALLPLAAVFVMSSAWATVTGHLPSLSMVWRQAFAPATRAVVPHRPSGVPNEETPGPSASPVPDTFAAPHVSARPMALENPPAAVEAAEARGASAPSATPVAPLRTGHVGPSASSSRPVPDAASEAEEALYTAAHRSHFVDRDPEAALRGWDAYVTAYPNGRFVLEARYNRALTLVRLGRRGEARAALAPFANGATGGYRQQEARALLDVLDGGE